MALKKVLAERFLKMSKTNCRISTSSVSVPTRIVHPPPSGSGKPPIAHDPGDAGIFRRLFHKRAILHSTPEIRPSAIGSGLLEKIRSFDIAKDRIRLDMLAPPPPPEETELTVKDVRKLLRAAQLELVKSRLRDAGKMSVTYPEFIRVCEEVCQNPDQAGGVAKTLDESGSVIVLGNIVFLQPDQIVKAIGDLIPFPATSPNDPRRKELHELEKQKAEIDKEADAQVRRELWGGLGFLAVQTAGFMRLTFWELSWDVMEPICFYVTSMYCMAGYAFFMRTSREPSFEGFYKSRFVSKQRKLMARHKFDLERYNQLKDVCYPNSRSEFKIDSFPSREFYFVTLIEEKEEEKIVEC